MSDLLRQNFDLCWNGDFLHWNGYLVSESFEIYYLKIVWLTQSYAPGHFFN